jgi:hypothetical protein
MITLKTFQPASPQAVQEKKDAKLRSLSGHPLRAA